MIVTHSRIAEEAIRAAEMLAEQGHRTGILLLEQITPVADVAAQIVPLLPQKACKILFLEEEIRMGGMGMILSDALRHHPVMQNKQVVIMATEDFGLQNANEPIWRSAGLDAEQIKARLLQ